MHVKILGLKKEKKKSNYRFEKVKIKDKYLYYDSSLQNPNPLGGCRMYMRCTKYYMSGEKDRYVRDDVLRLWAVNGL